MKFIEENMDKIGMMVAAGRKEPLRLWPNRAAAFAASGIFV